MAFNKIEISANFIGTFKAYPVQQQQEQQKPSAYNSVAQMYNVQSPPATAGNKDTGTQECGKLKPDADSPTCKDEYSRSYW